MDDIHIFKAGRHTTNKGQDISFSQRDIDAIAASYNPAVHEAPIVVGHPAIDAPAYGWVASLTARPDGLFASPRQVSGDFAELVRQGSYKKVSASFYMPDAKGNPKPGGYYLRHVGFLGGTAPAVRGLRAVQFGEDQASSINFEEGIFDLREHRLREGERQLQRNTLKLELNRLMKEARIRPSEIDGIMAFAETLSGEDEISFSEHGEPQTKSQYDWFLRYLQRQVPIVPLGELAAGDGYDPYDAAFSSPEGYDVSARGMELHTAALAYQGQHGGSYTDAARAVEAVFKRGRRHL